MNILVVTTIYRDPEDTKDSDMTPVVHYFARSWAKMGHRVLVVHNFNTYLAPLYHLPKKLTDRVFNRLGFRLSLNPQQRRAMKYELDGVQIYRMPILKVIPMGGYGEGALRRKLGRIEEWLAQERFTPDVIVGHAENPQIWQLWHLKQRFPEARTAIVFHGVEYLQRRGFERWRDEYLPAIGRYGFRAQSVHRKAQELLGFDRPWFLCPSGISDRYVETEPNRHFDGVHKLLYVGQLIRRKHLRTVLEAMHGMPEAGLELRVIGDGSEREEMEALAREWQLPVTFLGKRPHDEVLREMRAADCFVMVSRGEVFGLVYLEAMSQGCITIASEKEGMEGIVLDGRNGFLCPAGDTQALMAKLRSIQRMTPEELDGISREAFAQARQYSETGVARQYLDAVCAPQASEGAIT